MDVRFITAFLCFLSQIYRAEQTCSYDIPHGHITWWCDIASDTMCPYSCDEGYDEHPSVSWVTCLQKSGTWMSLGFPMVTGDNFCTPKSCPSEIPNGKLSSPCASTVGSSCGYTCNTGYQPKNGVSTIKCETSTNWSVDPHSLCTNNNQCPYELTHGDLDLSCRRSSGESCDYACHLGYLPLAPGELTTVTCGSSLTWDEPLSSLCGEILCPATIPNGYIPTSCSRNYRSSCYEYRCNTDYQKPPGGPSLRCNASGQWDWERAAAKTLCTREEDLCPSVFKNGKIVWHCSRQHGDTCTYSCDQGCTESNTAWLNCKDDSTWDKNTDSLCTNCPTKVSTTTTTAPVLCPAYIPSGQISTFCHRSTGSTCAFVCDTGCYRTVTSLYCGGSGTWTNEDTACNCSGQNTTSTVITTTPASTTAPVLCPYRIPNGQLEISCSRSPGSRCNFVCNSGCSRTLASLYCDRDGTWNFGDTPCTCYEHTTTTVTPKTCPSIIPNGRISSSCRRMPYSICQFRCNTGCSKSLSILYCKEDGGWEFEESACRCEETHDGEDSSFNSIGIIIGGSVGAFLLVVILIGVICVVRVKQRLRDQIVSNQPVERRINQPAIYQGQTNQTSSPGIQNGASNPVDSYPPHQYTSLQEQYNSYLTPYSAIQVPVRTNSYLTPIDHNTIQLPTYTGGTQLDQPPEYSSIVDINSGGYSTIAETRRESHEPPPPSYEETTAHPDKYKS